MIERKRGSAGAEDTKSDIGWASDSFLRAGSVTYQGSAHSTIENSNCNAVLDGDLERVLLKPSPETACKARFLVNRPPPQQQPFE